VTGRANASRQSSAPSPLTRLLTVQELAHLLQVPPKTIYTWRYKGIGPPAIPIGRYLRFRIEDVVAWLEAREESPHRIGTDRRHERTEPPGAPADHGTRAETRHKRPLRSQQTRVVEREGGGVAGKS
jgi:excisionase family DNA binding protein